MTVAMGVSEDPDDLVDALPQPFRMLDEVIAKLVEDAIDECIVRENADRSYGIQPRGPSRTARVDARAACVDVAPRGELAITGDADGGIALVSLEETACGDVLATREPPAEGPAVVGVACCRGGDAAPDELFCALDASGALTLLRLETVEEPATDVDEADAGGGDADADDSAADGGEGEPTGRILQRFGDIHRLDVPLTPAEASDASDATEDGAEAGAGGADTTPPLPLTLAASPDRAYVMVLSGNAAGVTSARVHAVNTIEIAAPTPEGDEADGAGSEDAHESADASSEGEATEAAPSFRHELMEVGAFEFRGRPGTSPSHAWVAGPVGSMAGLLFWEGRTLTFFQIDGSFRGAISGTSASPHPTWRVPFEISCATFDAASDLLIIGSTRGTVVIWRMFYRGHVNFLHKGCHATALRVVPHPASTPAGRSGRALACASSDRSVCLVDLDTKQVLRRVILSWVAAASPAQPTELSDQGYWMLEGRCDDAKVVSLFDLRAFKPALDVACKEGPAPGAVTCVGGGYLGVLQPSSGPDAQADSGAVEAPEAADDDPPAASASAAEAGEPGGARATLRVFDVSPPNRDPQQEVGGLDDVPKGGAQAAEASSPVFRHMHSKIARIHGGLDRVDADFEAKKADIKRRFVGNTLVTK